VTHVTRPITADEYDAAVMRAPEECPLFAMGDLRSGRQLLEDCAADRRICVHRVAESRRSFPRCAASPSGGQPRTNPPASVGVPALDGASKDAAK
jgi:hypothetical protein